MKAQQEVAKTTQPYTTGLKSLRPHHTKTYIAGPANRSSLIDEIITLGA
jgi:hypothetical protein